MMSSEREGDRSRVDACERPAGSKANINSCEKSKK